MSTGQMPQHSHTLTGTSDAANVAAPTAQTRFANVPGGRGQQGPPVYTDASPDTALNAQTITTAGNSQPISLIKPVVALNYIIALVGVFPPRS